MRFDTPGEIPHPSMVGHQIDFLQSRLTEIAGIVKGDLCGSALTSLFHDWASFSVPYGFGKLAEYAKLGLAHLSASGHLPDDFLKEVREYLMAKSDTIS